MNPSYPCLEGSLADALKEQIALYRMLRSLVRKEQGFLQAVDPTAIGAIQRHKERLIRRIERVDRWIAPFREEGARRSLRGGRILQERVEELKRIMNELASDQCENKRRIEEILEERGRTLSGLKEGKKQKRGYALRGGAEPPRFIDFER